MSTLCFKIGTGLFVYMDVLGGFQTKNVTPVKSRGIHAPRMNGKRTQIDAFTDTSQQPRLHKPLTFGRLVWFKLPGSILVASYNLRIAVYPFKYTVAVRG